MATDLSFSTAFQIAFCLALMFVILTGNSFVVAAYFSNFRLRTGTYAFLVSLAISDLLDSGMRFFAFIYVHQPKTHPERSFEHVFPVFRHFQRAGFHFSFDNCQSGALAGNFATVCSRDTLYTSLHVGYLQCVDDSFCHSSYSTRSGRILKQ